jgi:hypothetical protein
MIEFIVPLIGGVGIGFLTKSIAWGLVSFFIISVICVIWYIMNAVKALPDFLDENLKSVFSHPNIISYNSNPISTTRVNLPGGRKKVTFSDGGIIIIEKTGFFTIIKHSPGTDVPF